MNRFLSGKIFGSFFSSFPFLSLIFVFVFAAPGSPSAATQTFEARVLDVVDGDTVRLDNGLSVRYLGIDAPEVRQRVGGRWIYAPEPFGEKASDFNRKLVEGKRILLEFDPEKSHDRFGRLLAYVFVGKRFVNEEMVRSGFAKVRQRFVRPEYRGRFRRAEEEARLQGLGVWSGEKKGRSNLDLDPEDPLFGNIAGQPAVTEKGLSVRLTRA